MKAVIASVVPGKLVIEAGCAKDYAELARFHYAAGRPASWAGVWVVRHRPEGRLAAIAVLSWPTVNCAARDRALGIGDLPARERLAFVNAHVRTISRVVVHPQYRGVGLASRLVLWVCAHCNTRFVEALAVMGRVHPFFEKGGMRRVAGVEAEKAYYLHDTRTVGLASASATPARRNSDSTAGVDQRTLCRRPAR